MVGSITGGDVRLQLAATKGQYALCLSARRRAEQRCVRVWVPNYVRTSSSDPLTTLSEKARISSHSTWSSFSSHALAI